MTDDERSANAGVVAVVRRTPFAENPRVGVRGRRTQQRILDAALRAFGEHGYHACSIEEIARHASCSRIACYQYFTGKEDVFRHLAEQVARQVSASTEALDPLTAEHDGWIALHAWVERYAAIHARYAPVFHSLERDANLAALARHTGEETIARVHARLATTTLPPRQLDPVIRLLLECLNHTLDVRGILDAAAPGAFPLPRIEVAITDVLHRTLFGRRDDVNVHPAAGPEPPTITFGAGMSEMLALADQANGSDATVEALLDAGRSVFVALGYHGARVDDLISAAGVSRGVFYRCFRNKEQLARALTARAVRTVGTTLGELPDASCFDGRAGRAALRRWLRRYHAAHANEAMMLRVWVDAALQDPTFRAESAPPLDWGRRRLAGFLTPRRFGDAGIDAVVMVALLGVFGARPRAAADFEAAAHIIERGLMGR
jgi:AcrR family transcriptional regulator